MKKHIIILLVLSCLVFVACDPWYMHTGINRVLYYFDNQSGHDVTIQTLIDLSEPLPEMPSGDTLSTFQNLYGIHVPSGEEVLLYKERGSASMGFDTTVYILQHFIYGDSVRFLFDDGSYLDYVKGTLAPHSPYIEDNYQRKIDIYSEYESWTYILSDEDYLRSIQL